MKRFYKYTAVVAVISLSGCSAMGGLARAHPGVAVATMIVGMGATVFTAKTSAEALVIQADTARVNNQVALVAMENTRRQTALLEEQRKTQQEATLRAKAERQEECFRQVVMKSGFSSVACSNFSQVDICRSVYAVYASKSPPTCIAVLKRAGYRV